MPFTGTVLDHLTKPRPDTRFCTGVLRQSLPAVRAAAFSLPTGLPAPPQSLPAATNVATTTTPPVSAITPATSAATAAAGATSGSAKASDQATPTGIILPGASSVPLTAVTTTADPAAPSTAPPGFLSAMTPAAGDSKTAHSQVVHNSTQAATKSFEPVVEATQQYEAASHADADTNSKAQGLQAAAPSQAASIAGVPASSPAPAVKQEDSSASDVVQIKPEPATSAAHDATAQAVDCKHAAMQDSSKQPGLVTLVADTHPAGSGSQAVHVVGTAAQGPATTAPTGVISAAAGGGGGGQVGLATAASSVAGGGQVGVATSNGPQGAPVPSGVDSDTSRATDPWNALDVVWDSDTPPAWPRLVCPWQVQYTKALA